MSDRINPVSAEPVLEEGPVFKLAKQVAPHGRVFHLLKRFSDEDDEVVSILVDNTLVLKFEFETSVVSPEPQRVEMIDVRSYRKNVKGLQIKILISAIQKAEERLSAQ